MHFVKYLTKSPSEMKASFDDCPLMTRALVSGALVSRSIVSGETDLEAQHYSAVID